MRNITLSFIILLIAATNMSCETDVPETDTTPPTFSLQITGDGFDRTFSQDDDLNNIQLNLKAGASYDFILGGIDNGGVRRVEFQHTPDYTPISTTIPSHWTVTNTGLSASIRCNGDINNALTAQLLAGSFTATLTSEDIVTETFYIRVEDFGGASGPPFNITEGTLNISIADQQTELINL